MLLEVFHIKGQPSPLFFEGTSRGKYIYCNNHEGIRKQDLSTLAEYNEGYSSTLIMNNSALQPDRYSLFIAHSNSTEFDIEVDAQFYSELGATIKIDSIGFEIPQGVSWACIEGWSDYLKLPLENIVTGYRTTPFSQDEQYIYLNQYKKTDWLSNYIPNYSELPPNTPINIVVNFEVISGAVDVNIAALKSTEILRDRSQHDANSRNGIYYRDFQYKGVADTLPVVSAVLVLAFDEDTEENTQLPVTIFNQYNKGGRTSWQWITQINPHTHWAVNSAIESDMIKLNYYDGEKMQYYGNNVPEYEKDPVWRFDVFHSDTKEYIAGVPFSQDNYKPNYPLGTTMDSNACNLGNWGVVTRYILSVQNYDSETRNFKYNLTSHSNNIVVVRNHAGDVIDPVTLWDKEHGGDIYGLNKGESSVNVEDTMVNVSILGMTQLNIIIDVILSTGNDGGMFNKFIAD